MANNTIKKHRERVGITREQLATLIGKSYSSVVAYEQGIRDPDTDIWKKMAEAFDVPVDELIGFEKKQGSPDSDLERNWPEAVQVLRMAGKPANPEESRRVARIIKALLEGE